MLTWKSLLMLLLIGFLFQACQSNDDRLNFEIPVQWEHVGFSGDQSDIDFVKYKQLGYKRLISLREIGEDGYTLEDFQREKQMAEDAGLDFYHVEFSRQRVENQDITNDLMEKIDQVVIGNEEGPSNTLVYCSSAARASAWLAWHLVSKKGKSFEEASSVAYQLGPQDENAQNALSAVEVLLESN